MLSPEQLLSSTRWLLRFVRATDPAREAVLMENERIAAGIPVIRERRTVYRNLHPTIVSAVGVLSGATAGTLDGRVLRLARRDVLYKATRLLSPRGCIALIGAAFDWSARGGLTFRPVMTSLPLEFGVTLAELMRAQPTVGVYRCGHADCRHTWAVRMGRGTGKGRKSHYCAAHEPDTTTIDRAKRQQKLQKGRNRK